MFPQVRLQEGLEGRAAWVRGGTAAGCTEPALAGGQAPPALRRRPASRTTCEFGVLVIFCHNLNMVAASGYNSTLLSVHDSQLSSETTPKIDMGKGYDISPFRIHLHIS